MLKYGLRAKDLHQAADVISRQLGVAFVLHDSSFLGGDYYRAEVAEGTIYVQSNYDKLDEAPFEESWPSDSCCVSVASFLYSYDLAGNLTAQQYPSGMVVSAVYDAAGRVSSMTRQRPGEQAASNVVSDFEYAAHAAPLKMKLGNNLWQQAAYNCRLQTQRMALGTTGNTGASTDSSILRLDYTYDSQPGNGCASISHDNNGNVRTQAIAASGLNLLQGYDYDPFNRLTVATEAWFWNQTYGYDRFGNRWVIDSTIPPHAFLTPRAANWYTADNNQLAASGGFHYDAAGNLDLAAAVTATYDGENRLVKTQQTFNGAEIINTYVYDGDGRRVKKVANGAATVYVYNAFGQMVAEYAGAGAVTGFKTNYLTPDHLGSTRVVTDQAGNVKSRRDYLPFGEEISKELGYRHYIKGYGEDDGLAWKFTGKERDGETGLDYFGARYFSGAQGRFTSADIPLIDQHTADPQSWNLYIYGRNNPLSYSDPTGQYVCDTTLSKQQCEQFEDALADAQNYANKLREQHGAESIQYTEVQRAIDAFGEIDRDNGVMVALGAVQEGAAAEVKAGGNLLPKTVDNQPVKVLSSHSMVHCSAGTRGRSTSRFPVHMRAPTSPTHRIGCSLVSRNSRIRHATLLRQELLV